MSHKAFIIFLLTVGIAAFIGVGFSGADYYLTPVSERAFRPDYAV
jgi:hypothetical protein